MRFHTLFSKFLYISPFLFICIYFLISVYKINYPGVQYDELLFTNAALGKIDNSFIFKEFKNIPVFLMPYIGALKAYIYFPIFKVFGVSVLTIRLPMILLTCFSLALIYAGLKIRFKSKLLALTALLLLSINSSLISLIRTDVGPNAIELFLKCLTLFIIFKFGITKKSCATILIVFGLGIFNKLNFIWFINAFYASLGIIYLPYILRSLKKKKVQNILNFSLGFGTYFLFLIYTFLLQTKFEIERTIAFNPDGFNSYFKNIYEVVTGQAYYNYVFSTYAGDSQKIFVGILLIIWIAGLILWIKNIIKRNYQDYDKWMLFVFFVFVFGTSQIFITTQATAPWHVFTIEPTFTILTSFFIFRIYLYLKKYNITITKMLIISVAGILTIYNLSMIFLTINTYENPKNIIWSNEIYDLVEFTKNSKEKVILGDWGFHTQFITFDHVQDKYTELFWMLSNDSRTQQEEELLKKYLTNDYLFVFHNDNNSLVKDAKINFFNLISKYNLEVSKIKTFKDKNGNLIYEIYKINNENPSNISR